MTKSELITQLCAKFPEITQQDTRQAIETILNAIGNRLAVKGRVEIRGFGSFNTHIRPARLGRNPKTGIKVKVPAKDVIHFKPGIELKDRVNSLWGSENNIQADEFLIAAKRESQERSRKLVRDGVRSQESMFFISPEIVKTLKIKHRA